MGSVALPPARKAPRRKARRSLSSSSTPKLTCWESVLPASSPKAAKSSRSLSGAVMEKRSLPLAPSAGTPSKSSEKARRKSFGSMAAKSGWAVTMRASRALKTLA